MTDATATLMQHVFALLVRDGAVSPAVFECVADAHERVADESGIEDKAADARAVADVARLILMLAEKSVPRPGLRLVADSDTSRDE